MLKKNDKFNIIKIFYKKVNDETVNTRIFKYKNYIIF